MIRVYITLSKQKYCVSEILTSESGEIFKGNILEKIIANKLV